MRIKAIFTIIVLVMSMCHVLAQGKKDIKTYKVSSETSYITVNENGKEVTYKDSYTAYDKDGKVTEQTEFYKDGTIKRKETNKYDSQKNKIEEVIYDGKDKTTTKTTYTYNANKDRIGEIEYDNKGNILKQSVIVYNSKGFKTEKKTYNAGKQLIAIKKYTYTNR
ncbi:MAG: hypothetical protein PHD97_09350 [Bacteroidales bacterium]|nr:hypothetical protein [Bacteroidales bacterium]